MNETTKERLLEAGLRLLLRHGYNDLGLQMLLKDTGTPRGSFYHHFASKQDFALQVVDRYMRDVHLGLDLALGDNSLAPMDRVRRFFELTAGKYSEDGYLGCMLGGLGQELSAVSPEFRAKIEECFNTIAGRIAGCMIEAGNNGHLAPDVDPLQAANLLINCWEGAALRSRLTQDPAPLEAMLTFYFPAICLVPRDEGERP